MQLTCKEAEDEYWVQVCLRCLVIDPYAWDPSAEHSLTEEEQDELCAELLGEKGWDDNGDDYDCAKLNKTLQQQGVNWRARQSFIRATVTKSTELASKANAGKKKQTFEEMILDWLHDFCSVFEKEEFDEMPPHRPWDHKIELVDGAQSWDNTRLIPLSDDKMQALDES